MDKKKISIIVVVLLCVICIFLICLQMGFHLFKYSIIGKDSSEIQDKYGQFDCVQMPHDTDGLYKNTTCSYFITDKHVSFLGTTPPYMFSIRFDASGIAYEILIEKGGVGGQLQEFGDAIFNQSHPGPAGVGSQSIRRERTAYAPTHYSFVTAPEGVTVYVGVVNNSTTGAIQFEFQRLQKWVGMEKVLRYLNVVRDEE